MSHEWEAQGSGVTKKISDLTRIFGESEEDMAMLWQSIEMCFKPHPKDPTKFIHPRLEKERKKQNYYKCLFKIFKFRKNKRIVIFCIHFTS